MPKKITKDTSPFKVVYYGLKYSGLINKEGRPCSLIHSIFHEIVLAFLVIFAFGKFLEVSRENIVDIILALSGAAVGIQILTNYYVTLKNEDKVIDLLDRLEKYRLEVQQYEKYRSLVDKADRSSIKCIKFITIYFLSYPLILICLNFYNDYKTNFEDPTILHQLRFPWNMHNPIGSFAGAVFTGCAAYSILIVNAAFCAFLFTFSVQISAYSKIIRDRMETEGIRDKNLYRQHQAIIKFITDYNKIFCLQMYVQIFVAAVEPCGFGYAMIKGFKQFELIALDLLYKVVLAMTVPFTVCVCGQDISTQLEKLHQSTLMSTWYQEDPKTRRDLLTMMSVTVKPNTLNFKMLVFFNLECFSAVMSGIYSYITLIANIEE